MQILQAAVRNRLLRVMSSEDFALIRPYLQARPGPAQAVLIAPDTDIHFLYFPETGFTSVTIDGHGGPVEVGMIGREGLVGAVPVLLGTSRTPHQSFVQMAGDNLRIATGDFQKTVAQSTTMRALLLRYVQTTMVQVAQTAWANATCDIEVRLARWILMCHDRAEAQEIHITHEFLAMMLGVRRPGVTVAIQILEGKRFIRATRGLIRMLDRPGLMAEAGTSYGLPEAEYARLIDGVKHAEPVTLSSMPDRAPVLH